MIDWIESKLPQNKRRALYLLLIGMFAMTRINIGGKLGISELVILCVSPLVFFQNQSVFRREKIIGFLLLAFLWLCGAIFSDWYNNTYWAFALKGIASPVMVLANVIVLYFLLRKNPENLRWLLLGLAISSVISIFVFQKVSDEELMEIGSNMNAISKVTGYKLFWGNMVLAWVGIVISGWYLQVSKFVSTFGIIMIIVTYMLCGGRSASASYLVTLVLVCIGGNRIRNMMKIRKSIIPIFVILALLGLIFKTGYEYVAEKGILGEAEQKKYERQTRIGDGDLLSLFMAGRSEIFIATIAALDRPIIGHGSHAIDDKGYTADFFMKYGTEEDKRFHSELMVGKIMRIPFHTQIVTFWMWHGIFGLIFWVFVLVLVVKTLMSRMAVFPPFFGYLALVLPITLWDLFFSPFGSRIQECTIIVICLIVRNMAKGIRYPIEARDINLSGWR